MKELKKVIPNSLSIFRILLVFVLLGLRFLGESKWNTMEIVVGITTLIYLTDFLDGKLARYWKSCTKTGEILDVSADFFYITSQYIVLSYDSKMPGYLLILVVIEFIVFIATSVKMMQMNGEKIFFFEIIGRFMAIYYYVLPLFYLLPLAKRNPFWEGICVSGTILAIGYRIYQTSQVSIR